MCRTSYLPYRVPSAPASSLGVMSQEQSSVRTGSEAVDAVLDQIAELGGRPVVEHVAVFEQAHEQLRRALDAAPQD